MIQKTGEVSSVLLNIITTLRPTLIAVIKPFHMETNFPIAKVTPPMTTDAVPNTNNMLAAAVATFPIVLVSSGLALSQSPTLPITPLNQSFISESTGINAEPNCNMTPWACNFTASNDFPNSSAAVNVSFANTFPVSSAVLYSPCKPFRPSFSIGNSSAPDLPKKAQAAAVLVAPSSTLASSSATSSNTASGARILPLASLTLIPKSLNICPAVFDPPAASVNTLSNLTIQVINFSCSIPDIFAA